MSSFSFNKIYVLESLPTSELQTGTELEQRINQWAPTKGIDCQTVTFQVHSMRDWELVWNEIYSSIEELGDIPIIHIEMHGNKSSVGIDGGANGIIPLNDVFQKVRHANVLSKNNVFLSLAVCMGLNTMRSIKTYEPMPFCGVFGSMETLSNDERLDNYTIFYKAFLSTLNLDKVKKRMVGAGIDDNKYELFKPEQIFINSYLSYLETYRTDEQIVEKALDAANKARITFQDEDAKQLFIRDYRCKLLLTENQEYQLAVNSFFIIDKYPENYTRFDIPQTIFDFKRTVGSNGFEWLLQKRTLTDDDIKGLSIQILNVVDSFCKENSIRYSLAYGTLLGAVRHKGFIPWDDDVDIMMLRPDYEKFISLFNQSENVLFSVMSVETDPKFHYPMAKIVCNVTDNDELGYTGCGFAIDLFPIDKVPIEHKGYKNVLKQKRRCWQLFSLKKIKWNNKRRVIKNIIIIVLKCLGFFIPYSLMHKIIKRQVKKYSYLNCNYLLGCLATPYGGRDIVPKDYFNEYIQIPFENSEYKCIKDYHDFLFSVYGNYMEIPPKEQRVSHHDFIAHWR